MNPISGLVRRLRGRSKPKSSSAPRQSGLLVRSTGAQKGAALLPAFDGATLSLYHWAPKEAGTSNFGDEMSPMIVARMLERRGGGNITIAPSSKERNKLLALGSVVQHAVDGDVIWGSGVNGKSWPRNLQKHNGISVRSVRGPLTRAALAQYGISCPEIYGDPGLLFPELFAEEIDAEIVDVPARVLHIPNLYDERLRPLEQQKVDPGIVRVSPGESPLRIAKLVSRAELVISSSLHGIVLADAYGIPCRPVASWFEPLYKYLDYFAGTGRPRARLNWDVTEALRGKDLEPATFSAEAIAGAFPYDMIAPYSTVGRA